MNYSAILMFLSVVAIIWRMFISPPGPIGKDYLLWSAAGLFGVMFVVFIFASLFQRKKGKDHGPDEIKRAEEWLTLVGERDRESMPWWAWAILLVGLAFEAAAVAIIAAPWISDFTEKYIYVAGTVLGILLAAFLGYLTHAAGKSLYKAHKQNSLAGRMEDEVRKYGPASGLKSQHPSSSDVDICYQSRLFQKLTKIESLPDEYEEQDMGSETYEAIKATQRSFLKRYSIFLLAWLIILIIAGGAFYARVELNKQIIENNKQVSSDIMGRLLPEETLKAMQKSQSEEVKKEISRATKQMYAALIILTMFYLLANIVGICFGYNYSFFCKKSERFYRILKDVEAREAMKAEDRELERKWKEKVSNAANKFFSKYYHFLLDAVVSERNEEKRVILLDRGEYTLQKFIGYKKSESGDGGQKDDQKAIQAEKSKGEIAETLPTHRPTQPQGIEVVGEGAAGLAKGTPQREESSTVGKAQGAVSKAEDTSFDPIQWFTGKEDFHIRNAKRRIKRRLQEQGKWDADYEELFNRTDDFGEIRDELLGDDISDADKIVSEALKEYIEKVEKRRIERIKG